MISFHAYNQEVMALRPRFFTLDDPPGDIVSRKCISHIETF